MLRARTVGSSSSATRPRTWRRPRRSAPRASGSARDTTPPRRSWPAGRPRPSPTSPTRTRGRAVRRRGLGYAGLHARLRHDLATALTRRRVGTAAGPKQTRGVCRPCRGVPVRLLPEHPNLVVRGNQRLVDPSPRGPKPGAQTHGRAERAAPTRINPPKTTVVVPEHSADVDDLVWRVRARDTIRAGVHEIPHPLPFFR